MSSESVKDNNSDYQLMDTANEYCRILLDILLSNGVKDIVLSPGSRNTPLLIGTDCRPFRKHIVIDEREAGFVAAGLSLAGKKPVAIICTSGTALYDYSPAVAEAYYQQLPLIVITADRPIEWIDQDDSQTLIQPGALSRITKGSYDIPVQNPGRIEEKWYVNRIINEACNLALTGRKGPVHINVRLDTPLSEVIEYRNPTDSDLRHIDYIDNLNLPPHIYKALAEELAGKKIMITAGFMQPDDALNKAISGFAKLSGVVLFCETISNLHLTDNPYCIDTALSTIENADEAVLEKLRPDIVISIGGALISRKLKTFLRKYPPQAHWTLGDTSPVADCFMALTRHIEVSPAKFFKGITKFLNRSNARNANDSFREMWQKIRNASQQSAESFIDAHQIWSELRAFHFILTNLPSSFNLFLSNGTTIRYAQLFTATVPHSSFACRGVSGIDGTSAAAIGCAIAYAGPTLLITGDMSFAYDSSVLGLNDIPDRFKIIVINNEGGGIFRFIPSTRNVPKREELFCANPNLPLEKLAEAYGWKYASVKSETELEEKFLPFLAGKSKGIMEIVVDGQVSADILLKFMNRNNDIIKL